MRLLLLLTAAAMGAVANAAKPSFLMILADDIGVCVSCGLDK